MPKYQVPRPTRLRFLLGPSQRLIAIFIIFILLPGTFLGVFALRVLRQEGRLASQRTRERLEKIVSEVGSDLDSEYNSDSATPP